MRSRRDRLIQPGAVHDRVLRQDLDVTTAADVARQRRDETTHDTQQRQPPAVVGSLFAGDTGTRELLRVLQSAGLVDDRTVITPLTTSLGDGLPTVTANSGAGTGATVTVEGTDGAGRLTVVAGTAPSPGFLASVEFAQPRGDNDYIVLLTAADDSAGSIDVYVDYLDRLDGRWRLETNSTLVSGVSYHWSYWVVGYAELFTGQTGTGAGGSGYTDEQVRDVIGAALVAGANVAITVNDVANTITVAATAGGGGAPTTATYITQTADAGLSAEQALSALATGLVKVTTGTGVLSTAVAADLPSHAHDDRYYTETETDTLIDGRASDAELSAHTGNVANPHAVTKTQVGLGSADNTTDVAKPISTLTQAALDGKSGAAHSHAHSALTGIDTDTATTALHHTLGTGANQAAAGSDARLSDARTPTAHTHSAADTTSGQFAMARLASGTPDGSKFVRDDGVLAAPAGVGGVGAPTGATYITQTPDLTLTSEQALSTLATGILKSTTATGVLSIAVGADLPAHTHTNDHVAATVADTASIDLTLTGQQISAAAIFGATAGTVAQGNDGRLSDVRTPTAHTHAQGDVTSLVTDLAGKAATVHTHAAADVTSGTFAVARVGTGSGAATTYLDGTGAFTTPAGGAGASFNETLQINTWLKQANVTTNTVLTSGLSHFYSIGRAQAAVASGAIVTGIYKVTVIAAGAVTWAEVALFKGPPVAFGAASLTRLGFASIATVVTVLGTKATAITLTTAIAAGDDLWLAIGGAAATTQFQIRGGLAEEIQFGVFQTATIRPSLAASPQATTLAAATVVPGSVGIRF